MTESSAIHLCSISIKSLANHSGRAEMKHRWMSDSVPVLFHGPRKHTHTQSLGPLSPRVNLSLIGRASLGSSLVTTDALRCSTARKISSLRHAVILSKGTLTITPWLRTIFPLAALRESQVTCGAVPRTVRVREGLGRLTQSPPHPDEMERDHDL